MVVAEVGIQSPPTTFCWTQVCTGFCFKTKGADNLSHPSNPFCLHQPRLLVSFTNEDPTKLQATHVCFSATGILHRYTVVEVRGSSSDSPGPDSNLQTHETWARPLLLDSCHEDEAPQRLRVLRGQGCTSQAVCGNRESMASETNAATVQLGELGT